MMITGQADLRLALGHEPPRFFPILAAKVSSIGNSGPSIQAPVILVNKLTVSLLQIEKL